MLVDSGVRTLKIPAPCDCSVIFAGKAGRCRSPDEPVGQGELQVCFTISFTGGLPPHHHSRSITQMSLSYWAIVR